MSGSWPQATVQEMYLAVKNSDLKLFKWSDQTWNTHNLLQTVHLFINK